MKWNDLAKKANPLKDLKSHRQKCQEARTDETSFDPIELPVWLKKLLQEQSHDQGRGGRD